MDTDERNEAKKSVKICVNPENPVQNTRYASRFTRYENPFFPPFLLAQSGNSIYNQRLGIRQLWSGNAVSS